MNQLNFDFIDNLNTNKQLELFPLDIYDNRISRLNYAIRLSFKKFGWTPYNIDNLKEAVKLFKVLYEDVLKQYNKVVNAEKLDGLI
jgi:hypothetical protein